MKPVMCPPRDKVEPKFKVVDHLTYSPAEMVKMVGRGQSVSTMSISEDQFEPMSVNPELPQEHIRGLSLVDAWNTAQDSKKKIIDNSPSTE